MVKEECWLSKWIKEFGFEDTGEIEVKYVQPPVEFFKEALEHNEDKKHRNRRKKPTQIKALTEANVNGEWGPNNDVICFTKQGRLINGQNRSTMFAETGKTAKVLIGINYPPSAFPNMDGAIARTVADGFHADNLDNDKELAVAVRLVWIRVNGQNVAGSGKLPTARALKVLNEHPDISDSTKFIVDLDKEQSGGVTQLGSLGYFAALHYLMSNSKVEKPKTTANEFFKQMADYDDLDKESAAMRLRVALQKNKSPKTVRKLDRDGLVALIINAWLLYVGGAKLEAPLKVQAGERPIIGGLDIEPEEPEEEVEEPQDAKPSECPKGGKHKWEKDKDSGEPACAKCHEPKQKEKKKRKRKKAVAA